MNLELVIVLVLSVFSYSAQGLSCIQCNSVYSPSCISSQDSYSFLYPCPSYRNFTVCRKIDQTVRGDRLVMRKCGWEVCKMYIREAKKDSLEKKT